MPVNSTINLAPDTLADYTRSALIVPELRERDAAGVISELSHALQRHGCVPDLLPFYHAALNQELMANSAHEWGLAFPHARLSGVKQLQFAFGRARSPLAWAKSPWPVQFVFLLAVPATDAASYLHLLAALARLGRETSLMAELRSAEGSDAILALLSRLKLRQ
jgi:mannitol/fructose-specific phosphotransferase system IIA component (Ntr-type)